MGNLDLDFSALLAGLSLFSGIVWGLDRLFFAGRRARAAEQAQLNAPGPAEAREAAARKALKEPLLVEYCRSFFPVLFIVLTVRSFIAEPFRIPSRSMMPTLLTGDFILVNKYAYGLRLPVLNNKVVEIGEPRRGEVIVFHFPGMTPDDPTKGTYYIKRVVGLPGDEITYREKVVYINGEAVGQELRGTFVGVGDGQQMTGAQLRTERLPGAEHSILHRQQPAFYPTHDGTWKIGEHQYFVLGDNRDDSADSRFWGIVPEQNLVGRAFFIWMNWDGRNGGVDFSRIGTIIR